MRQFLLIGEKKCPLCGIDVKFLRDLQSIDRLKDNNKLFDINLREIEKGQQESLIREKEHKKQKNKNKRKIIVFSTVATLFAGIIAIYFLIITPYNKYEEALSLIEKQDYTSATAIFEELGGYKDSYDLFCQYTYEYANQLMEQGDYFNAYPCFEKIKPYKDSEKGYMYCYARVYKNSDEQSKITTVMNYLNILSLEGYKDSKELFADCWDIDIIIFNENDSDIYFDPYKDNADTLSEIRLNEINLKEYSYYDFVNISAEINKAPAYQNAVYIEVTYPNGDVVIEDECTYYVNVIWYPKNSQPGYLHIKVYDEKTGFLLESKKVKVY